MKCQRFRETGIFKMLAGVKKKKLHEIETNPPDQTIAKVDSLLLGHKGFGLPYHETCHDFNKYVLFFIVSRELCQWKVLCTIL